MLSAAGRTQLLYGIVQDGLLLVDKFDGVVDFGCTVCHGDSFRALRGRHYRLDTKKPYILADARGNLAIRIFLENQIRN